MRSSSSRSLCCRACIIPATSGLRSRSATGWRWSACTTLASRPVCSVQCARIRTAGIHKIDGFDRSLTMLACQILQTEDVVEIAKKKQATIRANLRAVEFEVHAVIEVEPAITHFARTRCVSHYHARPSDRRGGKMVPNSRPWSPPPPPLTSRRRQQQNRTLFGFPLTLSPERFARAK
jgi:hypothetical protein